MREREKFSLAKSQRKKAYLTGSNVPSAQKFTFQLKPKILSIEFVYQPYLRIWRHLWEAISSK